MKYVTLGRTDLSVSALCLGSMTWGSQNTIEDAHEQINTSLAAGINFVDTAEMYPVNPVKAETVGRTERIIGQWFERVGQRANIILATKHSGEGLKHVRDGAPITPESIPQAIEGSLRRLNTDYIDLYQFHWPNRGSYMFRQNWSYDPSGQKPDEVRQNMADCMGALQDEIKRGTIRHFGLSNESAWGMSEWLKAADATGGPRPVSLQNEYSLMCRLYDTDLGELSCNENITCLPFSPLAAGLLTGKYQGGAIPKGSRMDLNGDLGGRKSANGFAAVDTYLKIAKKFGLDATQMALAWSMQRPFKTSSIFGATTMAQLENSLKAADLVLSDEVMTALDVAGRAHPQPY